MHRRGAAAVFAVAAVLNATPSVPAGSDEDDVSASFERELAELSFALHLTIDLGLPVGDYACTEPPASTPGNVMTCYTLIDGDHLVVALTTSSGGTGVHEFETLSDISLSGDGPDDQTTATSEPGTDALPDQAELAADALIMGHGNDINRGAAGVVSELLNDAEGEISVVNTYAWNPVTAIVTFDVLLDPKADTLRTDFAFGVAGVFANQSWGRGKPFRITGATVAPSLVLVVDGRRFVSDYDTMVLLADRGITQPDWVAATSMG
ncbi:hypothetical protein BH24ACT5_BH24ACT5_00200 [soil metagenome]